MLFNSVEFGIFLPVVFILYWFVLNKNIKIQNLFLLAASYFFYGWWNWKFLSLLIFSSVIDYILGLLISDAHNEKQRKALLITSVVINIGLLGFFKYFNFFTDNFINAFTFFGAHLQPRSLNIILPVGISFYTFQSLSYTIDIYRRKLEASRDLTAYLTYVSFFPQLVAGPIERATNLLPQFFRERKFDYNQAVDGIKQMLWGLFKKVVVADNLSKIVEEIFNDPSNMSSLVLLIGLALFSIQIYSDFSGYSDIAIGCSRLFGFELKINFRYPLFARNVGERWRNWHISLSTWFRDYIYIPMGGSRGSNLNKFKNLLILYTISGFWHGANWTFVCWGILNGLYFAPSMLLGKNRKYLEPVSKKQIFPTLKEFVNMFVTFWLIATTYIFFRAENIRHSKLYFLSILHNFNPKNTLAFIDLHTKDLFYGCIFIIIMLSMEWLHRDKAHGLCFETNKSHPAVRWAVYYVIIFILVKFAGTQETFIYFQF